MKDVMAITQAVSGNDAARINVGLGDTEGSGDSFEAALNEQMMHGEQSAPEQAEAPANAAAGDDAAKPVAAVEDETTLSGEVPAATLEPVDVAMASLLPVVAAPAAAVDASADVTPSAELAAARGQTSQPIGLRAIASAAASETGATVTASKAAPGVATGGESNPDSSTAAAGPTIPGAVSGLKSPLVAPADAQTSPLAQQLHAGGAPRADAAHPQSVAPVANQARISAQASGARATPVVASDASAEDSAARHLLGAQSRDGDARRADSRVGAGTSFASALGAMTQMRMDPANASLDTRALPPLDAPMDSAEWGEGLGARIVWGLGNGIRAATLAVHPRELGPVNIQLTMGDDEATIHFTSQHVMVREAIEAALPRLREALANEGIRLGDVAVGGGGESAADADPRSARSQPDDASPNDATEHADTSSSALRSQLETRNGLVDTFA